MSRIAVYALQVGEQIIPAAERQAGTLRWSRGLDQMRVLSPPRAGQCEVTVTNHGGGHNPGGTPLRAGQVVALAADHGGLAHPLFRGVLERPLQQPRSFVETVDLQAFGTLSRLTDARSLSTELHQDIRTDEAIGYVLDAAGWPAGDRSLDEGRTLMRWWWLDGVDAFAALRELLATEGPGALLFEDGDGRVVFKNRHARIVEERSASVQATYGTGALPLTQPWDYDDGLSEVVNRCTLTLRRRVVGEEEPVWALGEALDLLPGEARTFAARGSAGALLLDAMLPTEAGGDFVVLGGSAPLVALDRTSGASIRVTVTGGAGGSHLDGLRLRARPVTVAGETGISNTLDTAVSQAEFGVRPYPLEVRAEIAPNVARDFANAVVAFYQWGRPRLRFSTVNVSEEAMAAILDREVGDRVRVVVNRLGIDLECLVLQREDQIDAGAMHRVTFGTEVASGTGYFRLDSSLLTADPAPAGSDVLAF